MIQVVNRHNYKGDGIYIGRPSPLGNPFARFDYEHVKFKVKTRREAIDAFEDWLDEQPEDSPAKQELNRLASIYREKGELVLVCSCAPSPCHGHIISKKILLMVGERT